MYTVDDTSTIQSYIDGIYSGRQLTCSHGIVHELHQYFLLSRIVSSTSFGEKIIFLHRFYNTYISDDRELYLQVLKESWTLFPKRKNREHGKKRKEYMKENGWYESLSPPPKERSALPLCSKKAVFLRFDQKGLQSWYKGEDVRGVCWWKRYVFIYCFWFLLV
jgi:hypothetical protein